MLCPKSALNCTYDSMYCLPWAAGASKAVLCSFRQPKASNHSISIPEDCRQTLAKFSSRDAAGTHSTVCCSRMTAPHLPPAVVYPSSSSLGRWSGCIHLMRPQLANCVPAERLSTNLYKSGMEKRKICFIIPLLPHVDRSWKTHLDDKSLRNGVVFCNICPGSEKWGERHPAKASQQWTPSILGPMESQTGTHWCHIVYSTPPTLRHIQFELHFE